MVLGDLESWRNLYRFESVELIRTDMVIRLINYRNVRAITFLIILSTVSF